MQTSMTDEQCCRIEGMYFGRAALWPDHQIASAIRYWEASVASLGDGAAMDVGEEMGNCQCGDIAASVFIHHGMPWCRANGREKWQRYDGPAEQCRVPYGVGVRARQLAAAWTVMTARTDD